MAETQTKTPDPPRRGITLSEIAERRPTGAATICGQLVAVRLLTSREIARIREQIPDPAINLPDDATKEEIKLARKKLASEAHANELRRCDSLRLALEIAASIDLEDDPNRSSDAAKLAQGHTKWSMDAPGAWCRAFAMRVSETLTADDYAAVQDEQQRIARLDIDQAARIGTEDEQGN